jgi:hypothetical protein
MTMRITTLILFAAVVMGAGACGVGAATTRHHGDAATAKTVKLPETGSIPEGKYATEEFEPAFAFGIEERGRQVALPEGQSTCSSRRSPPT